MSDLPNGFNPAWSQAEKDAYFAEANRRYHAKQSGAVILAAVGAPGPKLTAKPASGRSDRSGSIPAASSRPTVRLQRADSIRPVRIRWLWVGWIALGKLILLAGAPGSGKTTIAMAFVAAVSLGGRRRSIWPDSSDCPEPGNVLIWSGEDDPEDTLVPRLLAAGADMSRVYFIDDVVENGKPRSFNPAVDIPILRGKIEEIGGVTLIVIDPIVNAVAGDSHKNTEVRRSLQPVVDLAADYNAAVIGITHLAKGTSGRAPTERVIGSLGFAALARVVIMAVKCEKEDEEPSHFIVRAKSNIGPDYGAVEYDLLQKELDDHPGIIASYVAWGEKVEKTAQQLFAEAEGLKDTESALDAAQRFLEEFLADGPKTKIEVDEAAKANSISAATLRRAKDALGIKPHHQGKRGEKGGGVWYWQLPSAEASNDSSNKVISFEARRSNKRDYERVDQLHESKRIIDSTDDENEQGAQFQQNGQLNPISQDLSDQGAQAHPNERLAVLDPQSLHEDAEKIGASSRGSSPEQLEHVDHRDDRSEAFREQLVEIIEAGDDEWMEGSL